MQTVGNNNQANPGDKVAELSPQEQRRAYDKLVDDLEDFIFSTSPTASDIATKAASLVGGDRRDTYGPAHDSFDKTATLWQAYLEMRHPGGLSSEDVAHMMVLFKISRTQSGAYSPDTYVDIAGYGACAGEIAAKRRG